MTRSRRISRRGLGQLLALTLPALPRPGWTQSVDQGIGGTGVVGDPKDESNDQMIGGTGVIGTIRRFGSIDVNGLRIGYAPTLPVDIDGASGSVARLRLGHVVRVATKAGPGPLSARSIAVEHEVVGPIDAMERDGMTVLGQTVLLDQALQVPALAIGAPVAVSGLRRLDGSIVASLVETAEHGPVSVAGPLAPAADGTLGIAGLTVENVDPRLAGQRVHVRGRLIGTTVRATRVVAEKAALARLKTSRFAIEGYVGRGGTGLRLGSGLQFSNDLSVPSDDGPVVVVVVVTPQQRLAAEKIERETELSTTGRQTRDTERASRTRQDRGGGEGSKHGSGGSGGSRGHR